MVYTIQPGDSLYKIANRFNLTVSELKRVNQIVSDTIYPGQQLFIPVFPDAVLVPGSRGAGVMQLQEVLSYIGYPITIDGIYGPQTEDVILNLQKKLPELATDGIYGPQTRAFIKRLLYNDYHIIKNPSSILALVNKKNALLHSYVPPDLVIPDIPFETEGFDPKKQLRREAAQAIEQLFAQAQKDNIHLAGVSGYRSYDRQAEVYRQSWLRSPSEPVIFSARAGESEHQTGLAMDVSSPNANYELEQWFGDTPEGIWLAKNAPDFGFILRYPKGKENITGYPYEPWHIRYVGKGIARQITDAGLTLEQYLSE
jgi:LAS superfamily LD-carboxypeptidase LdcB/LysM repeat protein